MGHTCQKVKFNKMRVKRRTVEKRKKKGAHETVFLLISGTHQMANIILDDGHFAKERNKKPEGREMKKGFMYLIIRWS